MDVRPLTGSIAAEVSDVDLRSELRGQLADDLRRTFLQHCVLVFPEQFLPADAQRRFARVWGVPMVVPYLSAHAVDGYPEILRVTNLGKENAITEQWHTDSSFLQCPPAITILAAQELPATGGDTMWANQYAAYESLSEGMKRVLDGLRLKLCGSAPGPSGAREPVFS